MNANLLIMLDSALDPHREINEEFIKLHHAGLSSSLRILNAPSLIFFQNEIGRISENINCFLDAGRIKSIAMQLEIHAKSSIYCTSEVFIYSLLCDTEEQKIATLIDNLNSLSADGLRKYAFEGLSLFRLLHIDFSLCLKCKTIDFSNSMHAYLVRITIFHIELILSFVKDMSASTHTVFQTSVYSANYAISQYLNHNKSNLAERYCLFLRNGDHITGFSICENVTRNAFLHRVLANNFSARHLMGCAIGYCKNYLSSIVFGNSPWSYSPGAGRLMELDPYSEFDLNRSKKIYSYFTSSPDEEYASEIYSSNIFTSIDGIKRRPFNSEYSAIKFLAIKTHSEGSYLLVRFHPRLGIESRVPFQSDSLHMFIDQIQKLQSIYPNIIIIYPTDKVSSYWLAGWSHNCFSLRSSMGYNIPLMGNPFIYMSDNAGLGSAGFTQFSILNEKDFTDKLRIKKISVRSHLEAIYGFYLSNYHANFKLGSHQNLNDVNIFRKSVSCGYSILAFLPEGSIDIHQQSDSCYGSLNYELTHVDYLEYIDLLKFLQQSCATLSSSNYFPLKYRISRLHAEVIHDVQCFLGI